MRISRRRAPTPFLLEPRYWQDRVARMETVSRSFLLIPRPDISSPLVDVVDWRLRAHDGELLTGIRGQSPFHPCPKGASIRQAGPDEDLELSIDAISQGCVDFVYRVPPDRRLEDRVLDALRVWQAALNGGVDPSNVSFEPSLPSEAPDEFMIAEKLLERGICARLCE
jgi:hypothetical protein